MSARGIRLLRTSVPSTLYYLLSSTSDPVLDEAMRQAEEYERWLEGKSLSAHQAMVLRLLRRVRELEAETVELRRLK